MTQPKLYKKASEGSRKKWSATAKRLENSGITVKEALSMSDSDLKQSLGFKGKKSSFIGLKKNIKQLSFDLDRKKGVLNDTLPKYAKTGYRGKGLNLAKVRLNKTIGLNTFFDISNEVKKKYNLTEKQAHSKTRTMLKQASIDFRKLSDSEKVILSYFS